MRFILVLLSVLLLWPNIGLAQGDIADAHARVEIAVQLPEGPSVRSIGLLLAARSGHFEAAGLNVTLIPPSAESSAAAVLADGGADLAVDIMPAALRARAEGTNIVHVAQIYQHATLALLCRPEIDQPGKLAGENIGVWLGGWESSFYAWLNRLGLSYFASGGGVTILRQGADAEMLRSGEVDCMTTTTYRAPQQFAGSGIDRSTLVAYLYESLGLGVLEDGVYARAEDLANPARVDAFARFLAAAERGWRMAYEDPAAALKVLAELDENAGLDAALLDEMLAAVNAAVAIEEGPLGRLDPAAYDRTVNLLLTGAPEPILTAAPDKAVSDLVTKQRRSLDRGGN